MPSDLYRTYQVLIEETVDPQHPKRGKSTKDCRYRPNLHAALNTTNELFQDAVCYYTIMLAGLAGNETVGDRPLNPLWREIAEPSGKYKSAADAVVQRMASRYAPVLGCTTAASLLERCLERPSDAFSLAMWSALGPRLYLELERDGTENEGGIPTSCKDMATFASNHTRDLCNPAGNQTPALQGVRNDNYFAELAARLRGPEDDEAISNSIELKWCFKTPDGAEVRGRNALLDYVAAFLGPASSREVKTVGSVPDALVPAGRRLIAEWGDEPKRDPQESRAAFATRKAVWERKAETFPLRSYCTKNKPNQRLWYCLRYLWCRDQAARESLLEQIKDCRREDIPADATNVVTEWKRLVSLRRVFPFFTCLIAGATNTAWLDFDDAAFATAAEDAFKFGIRSRQRAKDIAKLRRVAEHANTGTGVLELAGQESPTGKPIVVRGMQNDRRRDLMVEMLAKLANERGLENDGYQIDTGTIGGWAGVRHELLKLESAGNLDEGTLIAAVNRCLEENNQAAGDRNFLHALCDPDYHPIWSKVGAEAEAANANRIRDFVAYYAKYSEWIADLDDLTEDGRIKPISYTFPGTSNRFGKISQRHFNFKARLGTRFVFPKLFTKTNDGYALVDGAEERTVTLSARRLKRDRILNAKGEGTAALWCPPLVIEEGDARPKAGKWDGPPPKMKEVSFNLMVEPRPVDALCESPVHLNVQLPIESREAGKLAAGQVSFSKGSLHGYAKKGEANSDKRRHWRWPCDLEPDDEIKPRDLWCGDGTQAGFSVKKWGLSPKGSWRGEPTSVPDFHVLSVDLGNRFCAAFARLRVHRDGNSPTRGRMLSPDGWSVPVFAEVVHRGTLRLQGEDAWVWDHKRGPDGEALKDADGKPLYGLQREPFGNDGRGRFPKPEELHRFRNLAARLVSLENLPCNSADRMTYPELGDHLAYRLRRRLSRTRMLFKLRWLSVPDAREQHNTRECAADEVVGKRGKAIGMLAEVVARAQRDEDEKPDSLFAELRQALADDQEWSAIATPPEHQKTSGPKQQRRKTKSREEFQRQCVDLAAKVEPARWKCFADRLTQELERLLNGESATKRLLEEVMDWCLPLRSRRWHWISSSAKPELRQGAKNECPDHVPPVMGMRGLSMRRLEQVLNLRQLCQSYAKIERRWLQPDGGINDLVIPRGSELHDPCRDLLATSNDLREQRVFQTAHLILTEALGLELKNPAHVERDGKTKKELKNEIDLHGSYQPKVGPDAKPLPRCNVIVLEDLSRYRTSQERTRAENSRLMKWAHRKIVDKLSDLVKPFGITLMLVDPAFSSRFDSRTGVAGIRANEVSRGFDQEMPYAAWKRRLSKSEKRDDLANRVNELAEVFAAHPDFRGTLFLAVEGGKEFFAARADENEGHQNADENAAINIGLRALAHPDRLDIFPRLRTRRIDDETVEITQRRGTFAAQTPPEGARLLHKGDSVPAALSAVASEPDDEEEPGESSERPDFFVVHENTDFGGLPCDESYSTDSQSGTAAPVIKAYHRPFFLKKVQEAAYDRMARVNQARLARLRVDPQDDIMM